MTTKKEMSTIEFCEGAHRSSEDLPENSKADLNAGGDEKSGGARTWRSQWEAALWAFAIAGWGVVAYLYHAHPSFP
jgi:hypothetical protein